MSTERVMKCRPSLDNLSSVILKSPDREVPSLSQVISGEEIPIAVQVNTMLVLKVAMVLFGETNINTPSNEMIFEQRY